MLWTFLLLVFLQIDAQAGLITCGDNLNLSPGSNCSATVDADFVIVTSDCVGPYLILARELDGDTIAFALNVINLDLEPYLGTSIYIKVIDVPSGTACESSYDVYDDAMPLLTCPPDTVNCNEPLLPANITPISITDNCGIESTTFVDNPIGPQCNYMPAAFIGRVERTWTVTDIYGNDATCLQTILIRRADTSMVVMPANITLECTSSTDSTITGFPTIDGRAIGSSPFCNFQVQHTDQVSAPSSCGSRTIVRQWIVSDNCVLSDVKTSTQVILLLDTKPPKITCISPQFYQTDPGFCNADIELDMPAVFDSCSNFTVQASIPGYPVTNDFTVQNLPRGSYTVTYTATDDCNNSSSCTSVINVLDNETPTAICKQLPVIGLPSNGTVSIPASVFNGGSTDNCPGQLVFTGRRGMTGSFEPTVPFTCADVAASPVMVTLRVAKASDPTSFNTCMVQVVVQDKLAPGITCPAPQTIQCTADYSDLSVFGSPYVFDACGFALVSTSTEDIENCGVGTIIRTFTATDPSGNTNTCTQTINVVNSTPYNGTGIVWPLDTMIVNYCGGPSIFDPQDLPDGYDFPTTPTSECAMLATNYTDQFFDMSAPACYKLVRTWKVIDWCQYTPGVPGIGIWTHQQIIAVVDTKAPLITFCPSDVVVSVGADCNLATVLVSPVTATDCSPEITITNNSPFATSPGANASGQYPQGIYDVLFTVEDGCGNEAHCDFTITVTDLRKPLVRCKTGLITELQAMAGQVMASAQAIQFDENSSDNCTDYDDLEFTIRLVGDPNPPTAGLVFDCEDVGEFFVEMWVTDEAGNSDYCVTSVFIQDNMDLCPFEDDVLISSVATVGGVVESMMGVEMPEVTVSAANAGMETETNEEGIFEINGLQQGNSYNIAPQKDNSPLNGVTTFDLALMTSHVLGTNPITSPYKLIAADVNRSGAITTFDILELRKMILHIIDDFSNNTSWRFVPKNHVFPNPANPFSAPFPTSITLSNVGPQTPNADFIGIKIGDINGNAWLGLSGEAGDRGHAAYHLLTDDRDLVAGEEVVVPFKTKNAGELLALQFTLEFETDNLELRGLEKGVLPSLGEEAFGKALLGQGVLTAAWFHPEPAALAQDDALFSLRFLVKKPGRLSELLSVTTRYTEALAYEPSGEAMQPVLEFSNQKESGTTVGFQLYQNQPNPFRQTTSIGFTLPERGDATLTIYDTDGRVLKTIRRSFEKGYNEVSVERSELQSGGVVFYKLETATHNAVRKMVLL